jgi:Mor family transcriptional regulator
MAQPELFETDPPTDRDLVRNEARLAEAQHAWPKTLVELSDVFAAHFRERGLDEMRAAREARLVVLTLAKHFGGRMWYVPRGDALTRALRDMEIWERFDGTNAQALAGEFGLSFVEIYRTLAEQRRLHRERVQPKLL